ncbi:MAG: sulfurtransferase complex subunit TusD [Anaerolineae bacterium]
MKFSILILDGPYQHQAADSAYHFIQAALEKGHEISGIFFYEDAVHNANKFQKPPGERNLRDRWTALGEQGIDMVACIAASTYRGMTEDLLIPNARIAGLGQLVSFMEDADRLVTFGD